MKPSLRRNATTLFLEITLNSAKAERYIKSHCDLMKVF